MITKVEEFRDKHTVSVNSKGDILITGFTNAKNEKCFCIMADGHRYHEYGISTGSLLLCQRGAAINDGDLIIVKEDGAFTIYLYLKDRKIENIMLIGDVFTDSVYQNIEEKTTKIISRENFNTWYEKIIRQSPMELAVKLGIPLENASLMYPSAVIYKCLIDMMEAEHVWIPGVHMTRGIAYEYAEQMKLQKGSHNFENDILMAAKNIGKRYAVNRPHVQNLEMTALAMFDATKKMHGMKERERLLLRMAVMLHDVGKYISLNNVADSSYNIIMSNEIIGLSHIEREMVALIAKYNTAVLPSYDELVMESSLSAEQYLTVSELTAIVRLANALDRSHLQKIQSIRAVLKERELHLSLTVGRDFTLEQGLCQDKLDFFNEVFSIQPIIKMKRQM